MAWAMKAIKYAETHFKVFLYYLFPLMILTNKNKHIITYYCIYSVDSERRCHNFDTNQVYIMIHTKHVISFLYLISDEMKKYFKSSEKSLQRWR